MAIEVRKRQTNGGTKRVADRRTPRPRTENSIAAAEDPPRPRPDARGQHSHVRAAAAAFDLRGLRLP
ncbi:MAG: hypothetical protein D6725_02500 [Planctomycetota bacterium]|nr:MAG: hypothetical protein D6725_02500 [Planctomycetota bacterium]